MKRLRVAAAAAVAVAISLAAPSVARAGAVSDWNLNASNAIFNVAGQGPQLSVPHMAMVHGAVYDAVNAIDGSRTGYLLSPGAAGATPFDSKEAATAAAAYKVLSHLLGSTQQGTFDGQYAAALAAIPDGLANSRGIAVGEAAAAAMIAARTNDGRLGPYRFPVGSGPGVWKPVLPAFVNDPNAWLKDVKPFVIESGTQFMSNGPLDLTSNKYADEYNEVKSLGSLNSTDRSADQTHAARYWAENPPRTWSRVLRTVAAQQGVTLVDEARYYASAYMSAADALITVWNDKARSLFWRPITAIREADTDGNPDTEADPNWVPLIATPPYPEHPSGHLGLSSSIGRTLQLFFDTDEIGWTDTNVGGMTRSFTSISQAVDEVVGARIWSGIHFRTADEDSVKIGKHVAQYRHAHYFKPIG